MVSFAGLARRFLLFYLAAAGGGGGVIFVGVGDFAVQAFAEEVGAFEGGCDALCVGLGDVEERVLGHEVDAAYVDTSARYVVVEHVDEVAGKESVGLACVDVYARHAALGGAAVFVLGGTGRTLGALFLRGFLVDIVDGGCVLVVVEQALELEREYALEQIPGGEPRQFLGHAGQVSVYFVVVDLDALDAVGEVVELFFYDVLGGGYFLALEFLADDAFDLAQASFFSRVYYGYRHTGLACAACAARAVGVYGGVVGQAVVDHMREVVHVEAAGGHVGGDEQRCHAVAEFLHHHVALLLGEVAVQGVGIVAVGDELVGYLLCVAAGAAEYYGVDIGRVVGDTLKGQIFVLGVDHVVDVAYVGGALVAGAYHYLLGVMHVSFGDTCRFGRHCGREHKHLAVFGHVCQNVVDGVDESHVEHLVGLVEHHGMHIVEFYHAAVSQVYEAAWGGYDYLHAPAQGFYLALDARTAVYGEYGYIGDVFCKVGEIAGYLEAKLAGGCEYEGLRHEARVVDTLYERKAEGGCLAGACLGECHEVVVAAEQQGYYFFLYGHRGFEAHFGNAFEEVVANSKVVECHN